MKRLSRIGALVTAGLVSVAGLSFANPAQAATKKPTKDIVDTAVAAGSFGTLAAALGAADLVDTLKSKGPFTVFAPTDAAFAKLPAGTVDALLKPENKDALTRVLTYHVVAGKVPAKKVLKLNGKTVATVSKDTVKITIAGKSVKVNDSNVTATDINATNGVIHVIDAVLLPPNLKLATPATKDIVDTAVAAGSFKTLAAALGAAGLVDTLKGAGPFTVFAPTDAAFAKLPAGTIDTLLKPENKATLSSILTYHVVAGKVPASTVVTLNGKTAKTVNGADVKIRVEGDKVFVNDSQVITTDIMASNGIIHVIDTVLTPPAAVAATPAPAAGAKDIVDTAVAAGSFKTLAAALGAAGLVDTLKGAGPFTVFAPTDAAFAKLPAGTVETLLKPENKAQLAAILTYHVVAGRVPAATALTLNGKTAKTVNGAELKVRVDGTKLFLNDSQVITPDIVASNGIIHVIDTVLLPPVAPLANNIVDVAVGAKLNTLVAAVKAAGLVDTLQGPGPFTVFAPSEVAFKLVGNETLTTLLKPENKATLASILTLHVVAGKANTAAELTALANAHGGLKTVNGKSLTLRIVAGKLTVNGAAVLAADVKASNGIVHVIDTVLIP